MRKGEALRYKGKNRVTKLEKKQAVQEYSRRMASGEMSEDIISELTSRYDTTPRTIWRWIEKQNIREEWNWVKLGQNRNEAPVFCYISYNVKKLEGQAFTINEEENVIKIPIVFGPQGYWKEALSSKATQHIVISDKPEATTLTKEQESELVNAVKAYHNKKHRWLKVEEIKDYAKDWYGKNITDKDIMKIMRSAGVD